MKLLFLTQVVDRRDAVLGFVPRWIEGLAAHTDAVRAVALELGDISGLPSNVDTREIGRKGKLGRYLRYRRVLIEALGEDGFDAVLAHMVPRYALVAERPARRMGAGLFLWYTHAGVDARLRRAVGRVDRVFTASPESLRLEPSNKCVTGHGIDLKHFAQPPGARAPGPLRLLSVGRLTPAKDPMVALEALARLRSTGREVELDLVGGGLARGDDGYGQRVLAKIDELGLTRAVRMHGAVPYAEVPALFHSADLLINASHTGSVDKVVLEAMAAGLPFLSCNDSIPHVLRSMGEEAAELGFKASDAGSLTAAAGAMLDRGAPQRRALGERLQGIVAADHEVDTLMERLVNEMRAARGHSAASGQSRP